MAESHQIQLNLMAQETKDRVSTETDQSASTADCPPAAFQPKPLKWWIQISVYTFLLLAGQSTAVLLGRLYFDKGGKGKWISTVVQVVGFPVLLPFYCVFPSNGTRKYDQVEEQQSDSKPSILKLGAVYICLGLLIAFGCLLYSLGVQYLPVSTFSLISASQLAFNALFSFVLNTQKFTPYIVNSLVVLTVSSTLLVFQNESSNNKGITKAKYVLGFVCTVGSSAVFGLILPLTQLAFNKVVKRHNIRAILDLIVYESLTASCATVVGLFASEEWKTMKREMEEYKLGRVSYIMTLVWIALCWQIFAIGSLKLVTEVSSLFSNVISTLGLPIVPVLAVFIFQDKMGGIKVVAMVLAIWGFVSYAYQCYLDNQKSKTTERKITT